MKKDKDIFEFEELFEAKSEAVAEAAVQPAVSTDTWELKELGASFNLNLKTDFDLKKLESVFFKAALSEDDAKLATYCFTWFSHCRKLPQCERGAKKAAFFAYTKLSEIARAYDLPVYMPAPSVRITAAANGENLKHFKIIEGVRLNKQQVVAYLTKMKEPDFDFSVFDSFDLYTAKKVRGLFDAIDNFVEDLGCEPSADVHGADYASDLRQARSFLLKFCEVSNDK